MKSLIKITSIRRMFLWSAVLMSLTLFVSCGDNDDSSNYEGASSLVDGVHVNKRKLLSLDVSKGGYDTNLIHFNVSYDDKGRLNDIVATLPEYWPSQTREWKMLSIDYDLRFIEYYVTFEWRQRGRAPVYDKLFFNLNSDGFISMLGSTDLVYNNEGYLVGLRGVKDMWTFAYAENEVIKFMLENLKSGHIGIYYTHYGRENESMYFAVNDTDKFNKDDFMFSDSDLHTISVLILYHAGLFGKNSKQCTNLSNSSSKNAIIEQISDQDKSTMIYHCSLVFE